jgi:protein-arginine kinase activator protein McsA
LSDELNYSDLSNQELENAIKKAVKKEDYELAARLRDEISKRTNKTKE